jgi:hypothetical protein
VTGEQAASLALVWLFVITALLLKPVVRCWTEDE